MQYKYRSMIISKQGGDSSMIKMQLCLKNGQQLVYDEINKVFIEGNTMTLSTFRGQYVYVNLNEVASFELKYPQAKAPKAFAMFKQIIQQINGGGSNENNS